ncbi:MAG TPA: LPS assembly lipoprotein LptE [Caldimonas sp.]|jgi:LPS-assembly lipoprotein|nr:LPS assembly lipoprotein LptE [Caldimonas sp.]HEV7575313.1 LPS assembly lipoprotein LptE [Caldimonas sp.]
MRRRLLLGAAVTLSGCGFALKRPPELNFKTIQLTGFALRSPLATELRTSLGASPTTRVVDSAGEAQVVLQAISEAREKVVVSQTAANQIREFELRLRFNFRVRTAAGKDLIPDSEILQRRSLTYTETAALAKEQEEAFLYRAMQSDIVSQVLRRLASLRLL